MERFIPDVILVIGIALCLRRAWQGLVRRRVQSLTNMDNVLGTYRYPWYTGWAALARGLAYLAFAAVGLWALASRSSL